MRDEMLEYIRTYGTGRENKISGRRLQVAIGVKGAQVRKLINELRSSGEPICSDRGGYWYSTEIEDLRTTLSHLHGRVYGMQVAISGLETHLR